MLHAELAPYSTDLRDIHKLLWIFDLVGILGWEEKIVVQENNKTAKDPSHSKEIVIDFIQKMLQIAY